ncbi:MAG: preprotein translocase subunit SecG [bacterium]|nr:MAG: preprotein translocase subunit SecG [bacterium]
MIILLKILHILVAVFLILVVLLQTGKGAEMGAAFGGASQTVFGGGGPAGFMAKLTTTAAVVFMLTSLGLAYLSSGGRSQVDTLPASQPVQELPVLPTEGQSDIPAEVPPSGTDIPEAGQPVEEPSR